MPNQDSWIERFEEEFRYEFCDGQGNGCYYETAPKIIDFIRQERERAMEEERENCKRLIVDLGWGGILEQEKVNKLLNSLHPQKGTKE